MHGQKCTANPPVSKLYDKRAWDPSVKTFGPSSEDVKDLWTNPIEEFQITINFWISMVSLIALFILDTWLGKVVNFISNHIFYRRPAIDHSIERLASKSIVQDLTKSHQQTWNLLRNTKWTPTIIKSGQTWAPSLSHKKWEFNSIQSREQGESNPQNVNSSEIPYEN